VKGRVKGAATLTVTHNEIMYACNQGDKFLLAIVLVNEDDTYEGPFYVRQPFDREPELQVSSINYKLSEFLKKAELQ
jgi:5,10-methylene-tetrahydrofolate dehydrogenase/methenyl tetrahydrofolate cyclohydrolase